jgi:hypothetical protein
LISQERVMPSSAPREAECWECGRKADVLISITIRAESGWSMRLRLCQSCYDAVYVPLAGTVGGVTLTESDRRLP